MISAVGTLEIRPGCSGRRAFAVSNRDTRVRQAPVITCFAATSLPPLLREQPPAGAALEDAVLKPLPRRVEGIADDPDLHNPLQRQQRLGTGWMGVILELEGVCVDYEYGDVATRAWQQLAVEESKPMPFKWALNKAQGMKNEQVIQEVFCWSRNPSEVRRLAARKEALMAELMGDRKPMLPAGVEALLDMLQREDTPVALVSSAPECRVLPTLREAELAPRFEVVITGDDVYRGKPDPEGYLFAAQRIDRPPLRCVVLGSSNLSVEAAHEAGMQCVAVAGSHPVYELTAADLVVRSLTELSFINLKALFALEEGRLPRGGSDGDPESEREGEEEEEEEEDAYRPRTAVGLMEPW